MPKYWMITDRAIANGVPGDNVGPLTYWVSDNDAIDMIGHWTSATVDEFKEALVAAADAFPVFAQGDNDQQKHVCFFIHGYNNGFKDAANRYQRICNRLFNGASGLGVCISLDWPSLGSILGYLPDRDHAESCAGDAADVFDAMYEWLLAKQRQTSLNADRACKAKISIIAHSMGNYLTQKALSAVWKRNNQPLSVSLINQLVMVAADVDNDLFNSGSEDGTDGEAVANLSYRITALYTGRDNVLGASAGLKHFGTRRLGRSGLASRPPVAHDGTQRDSVWDVDCSRFFPDEVSGIDVHGAYFETDAVMALIGAVLSGTDRTVLVNRGLTSSNVWPPHS
jgi:esterase/lipase superfamily enzyme